MSFTKKHVKWFASIAIFAIAGLVVHDALVPVEDELSTRSVVSAILLYRRFMSPKMGTIVQCRFEPTCSAYGLESVRKYGAVRGGWRALKRIAKCNPSTPLGTSDPP